MKFILGFIVMIILIIISSVPIFIVLKFKGSYGNVFAWGLFFICIFTYIVLKVFCIEFGILSENKQIPYMAIFAIYSLSRLGVKIKQKGKS